MLKKNIFKKKFDKSVISITRRIESFFNFLKENFFKKKKKYQINFRKLDKKIFLTLSIVLLTIIGYFLIPAFYDKNKIIAQLENQILNQYNLIVKFDESLRYGLFPKPHFFSKNTKVEYQSNDIAQSNNVKVFISMSNFFSSDKLKIKNLLFKQTDFRVESSNFKFFIDLLNIDRSDSDINFLNSKFFYLDQNNDVIFITKLKKLNYFYQDIFLIKLISKLDIFNIPISLYAENNILKKSLFIEIKSYPLRLNIKNNSNFINKEIDGELDIDIINKYKKINYRLENNLLSFNTNDNKFTADISIKPFYLSSNLKFNQIDLKEIFKDSSILVNVIKSEVLNNQNLNGKINISTNQFKNIDFFNEIKFDILLEEGNIFIQNFITTFKDSVIINSSDVQLISDDNKLKFTGYMSLEFNNINAFYKHYQINRKKRKDIKKINFGFLLDLDDNLIEIDNLKIDGNTNQNLDQFLNNFNSKEKNIFNKIIRRNLVKNFFDNF
tara:strand:+ start:1750 stop:3237 length:1488 start_codon:yes stop_codon:yes gene_type:complete